MGQFSKCVVQTGSVCITWLHILGPALDLSDHKLGWNPATRLLTTGTPMHAREPLAFDLQHFSAIYFIFGYKFVLIGGFPLYDTKQRDF